MYLLDFDFSDPDTRLFFAILGLVVWAIILFNIIKLAVRSAITPLHNDLLRLLDEQVNEKEEEQ